MYTAIVGVRSFVNPCLRMPTCWNTWPHRIRVVFKRTDNSLTDNSTAAADDGDDGNDVSPVTATAIQHRRLNLRTQCGFCGLNEEWGGVGMVEEEEEEEEAEDVYSCGRKQQHRSPIIISQINWGMHDTYCVCVCVCMNTTAVQSDGDGDDLSIAR
ncbi:hypothetical protein Aperf_G00000072328 [Anoplocephala perfoliata]